MDQICSFLENIIGHHILNEMFGSGTFWRMIFLSLMFQILQISHLHEEKFIKPYCGCISRSAYRIPNFTNPKFFVCLLFEYFFQIKVLNWYQNTPKNANITPYIEKKKTLCNTLNWGNWNSGFVKLDVRWAERDKNAEFVFLQTDTQFFSFNELIRSNSKSGLWKRRSTGEELRCVSIFCAYDRKQSRTITNQCSFFFADEVESYFHFLPSFGCR